MPVELVEGQHPVSSPELHRLGFEGSNFPFQSLHFARLIILLLGTGQLLLEHLQFLLDDFQAFLVAAVHLAFLSRGWRSKQPA